MWVTLGEQDILQNEKKTEKIKTKGHSNPTEHQPGKLQIFSQFYTSDFYCLIVS